jgi:tetratricopeptide (TPR) repeat protein
LEETEVLFRQALKMNRQMLDPTHSHIAFNLSNLAAVLDDKGDYETAESLYREVLDIRKQTFGDAHPDIAQTMTNIAFLLYHKGEHEQALALETESIEMYRQFFPEGHPFLARELATLGGWLTREHKLEDAERLLVESLEMRRGMLGEKHPEVAGGMTKLAYLYLKTERAEEAREMANGARLMFVDLLPGGHWRTAWSASVEGASLTALGQFDAAEQLLLESYETLRKNKGGGRLSVYIDESREFLFDLYTGWAKPDQAAKYVASS